MEAMAMVDDDDNDDDDDDNDEDDDEEDNDANEWWILHFLTLPNRSLGSHFLSACINKIIISATAALIRLSRVVLLL